MRRKMKTRVALGFGKVDVIEGLDKTNFGGAMGLSARLERSGERREGAEVGKRSIGLSLEEFCYKKEQSQGW